MEKCPPFYVDSEYNPTFDSLLFDYARHVFPDEGLYDTWLASVSPFQARFSSNDDDDEWKHEKRKIHQFCNVVDERTTELAGEGEEATSLSAIKQYLRIYQRCDRVNVASLAGAIAALQELEAESVALPAEYRETFIQRYRVGVDACQKQIAALGGAHPQQYLNQAKTRGGCLSIVAISIGGLATMSACAWIISHRRTLRIVGALLVSTYVATISDCIRGPAPVRRQPRSGRPPSLR